MGGREPYLLMVRTSSHSVSTTRANCTRQRKQCKAGWNQQTSSQSRTSLQGVQCHRCCGALRIWSPLFRSALAKASSPSWCKLGQGAESGGAPNTAPTDVHSPCASARALEPLGYIRGSFTWPKHNPSNPRGPCPSALA